MAYIIGLLSKAEEKELRRRGWEIEDAPRVNLDTNRPMDTNDGMKKVWVDASMFEVMSGPDWEKGPLEMAGMWPEGKPC